jgi:hypothetical protein
LQILEGHDKRAGYLDSIDWLTIDNSKRLQRDNERLRKETDQIKELQRQIVEINKKIGVKDPSDLSKDIRLYEWLNHNVKDRKLCWAEGDIEGEHYTFGEWCREND